MPKAPVNKTKPQVSVPSVKAGNNKAKKHGTNKVKDRKSVV